MESKYIDLIDEVYVDFSKTYDLVKDTTDDIYIKTLKNNGGWNQFSEGWKGAEGKEFKEIVTNSENLKNMIEDLTSWSEMKLVKNLTKEQRKKINRVILLSFRKIKNKNKEFRKVFFDLYCDKLKEKGLL